MKPIIAGISIALQALGISTGNRVLQILSLLFLLIYLTDSFVATAIERAASFAATILSGVFLFLVFFLVVTPISFLRRVLEGNVLLVERPRNAGSYWKAGDREFSGKDLEEAW